MTFKPQSKFDFLIEDLGEGVTRGGINQVREYYNRSEFDHAIALAAEIVKSDPANYDATRLLARTLDRVGDIENALIIWELECPGLSTIFCDRMKRTKFSKT